VGYLISLINLQVNLLISSSVREFTFINIEDFLSYGAMWIYKYLPIIWTILLLPSLELKLTLLPKDDGRRSV